ncbi:MAG: ecdysteroid 22-kinase family protein [bacterium]|nr:ecdysteroid 22-kinase family protein [bacterium]
MTESDRFDANFTDILLRSTGAATLSSTEVVQSLWSGYGQIVRCHLTGGAVPSVVLKHVRWPNERAHPYGWTSDRSHQRKLKSYQVETAWYARYAERCLDACRVPHCLAVEHRPDGVLLLLEDLNAAGFAGRRRSVSDTEVDGCLSWLANFHATFMGNQPKGLWTTGTYWHLATRPDELDRLDDSRLKAAAVELDRRLSDSPFQTFVHGDAKLANFCFSADGRKAAAVDFQYVGGGCGMKDVAYFISSCFDEDECERRESSLLDRYFELLREALERTGKAIDGHALEADWRELYPVAWTDFFRFLQGWSPGHWKAHRYSKRLASKVLDNL